MGYGQHFGTVKSFYIDMLEVTAGDFAQCVKDGQCLAPGMRNRKCADLHDPKLADHPMNCVTYYEADRYCLAHNKRMPTAQEWELAARGTDHRVYPWGNAEPRDQVCWQGRPGGARTTTCPVGSFPQGKSPSGAMDMAGNLSEWTSTTGEDYTRSTNVVAGGSYLLEEMDLPDSRSLRADQPRPYGRADAATDIGFRCAQSLEVPVGLAPGRGGEVAR
jgi:formylglycine-generating enzyme required for sulfatase activity